MDELTEVVMLNSWRLDNSEKTDSALLGNCGLRIHTELMIKICALVFWSFIKMMVHIDVSEAEWADQIVYQTLCNQFTFTFVGGGTWWNCHIY